MRRARRHLKDLTDNVNPLPQPHHPGPQYRRSDHAVRGDLFRARSLWTKGEILELKKTINTMVDCAQRFCLR